MTGAQASYLKTLSSRRIGPRCSRKASRRPEASERIDALKNGTKRTAPGVAYCSRDCRPRG
ncbi:MAG: DUF3072 domain-containing protein [Alphaproteobacteria bacterium]|nr:DUF3072 domain-containing protein [Alphaproteobacteria bacterium]